LKGTVLGSQSQSSAVSWFCLVPPLQSGYTHDMFAALVTLVLVVVIVFPVLPVFVVLAALMLVAPVLVQLAVLVLVVLVAETLQHTGRKLVCNEALLSPSYVLRSRVLLEKLTVTQLVRKFPAFYAVRRFITMFTRARHWSLS